MTTFITSLILYGFMAGVFGMIGKLIYDIQQSKKQDRELENEFEAKDKFQTLAGIKGEPTHTLSVDELKKKFENTEFPAPDPSIPVITAKLTTIGGDYGDSDPLASVPMSRVSKKAKQKMAEIAKEDINKQLEQNAEKFASIFPNEIDPNDQRLGIELVKPKRKYTKKKTK